MCGLAGIARLDGSPVTGEFESILAAMTRLVSHRGPDDASLTTAGRVGLGFTRLSLVDPATGQQPLTTRDGRILLIANGEVYNHRELEAQLGVPMRTASDCEVLVHLYEKHGVHFLDHVRGMFAIVIWDQPRNRLVFARDHFGIKPLYYSRDAQRVVFASEIKALFADPGTPRRIDWGRALADQALNLSPTFTDAAPTSWFEDVHSVPAGCVVTIDLASGRSETHRYWSLPVPGEDPLDASDDEFIAAYRELLIESVTACATADAEIGLFLSGGVDSSAVAAIAAHLGPLHTFTALSGSTAANGDAEYAHRLASTVGLPNHQILFGPHRRPDLQEWKRLLWLLETPLGGPEQFYKYEMHRYAKLVRPELRGMLLGQASDEFNGGYSTEFGADWAGFEATLGGIAQQTAQLRRPGLAGWSRHGPQLLTDAALGVAPPDPYASFVAWKYRDIQQYNNWHEDRTAAGNGVEARVPFLDHRLVELTARIPRKRRAGLLWDKRILRSAVADLIPAGHRSRPKVAFYQGPAARHTRLAFVRMMLAEDNRMLDEAMAGSQAREYVRPDGLRRLLLALAADPRSVPVEVPLRLVNLGLLENMLAELPAAPIDWPRQASPEALAIQDWAAERGAILERTATDVHFDGPSVPVLRDGVLFLRTAGDSTTWFVAVDGDVRYVVDSDESPGWVRLVHAMDGVRTLEELIEAASTSATEIGELLAQWADLGLLTDNRAAVPAAEPVH